MFFPVGIGGTILKADWSTEILQLKVNRHPSPWEETRRRRYIQHRFCCSQHYSSVDISDSPYFTVKYILRQCSCVCHVAIVDANTSEAIQSYIFATCFIHNSLKPHTSIPCRRISSNRMQDKEFPARYVVISHSGWPLQRLEIMVGSGFWKTGSCLSQSCEMRTVNDHY